MNRYEQINGQNVMFKTVNFELTRRCNMNCVHCARGESQNIDMSRDIIDAATDQFRDHPIITLRLYGGEPLLALDEMEYLIDSIIEKDLRILACVIDTNGMIRSERAVKALNKLGDYIEKRNNYNPENYKKMFKELYKDTKGAEREYYKKYYKKLGSFEISDFGHENREYAKETVDFYKKNLNKFWAVWWQGDRLDQRTEEYKKDGVLYTDALAYEGNAAKNFEKLRSEFDFRIKDKRGSLREFNTCFVQETIMISANGNITNSSLVSYDKVDNDIHWKIGNILTDDLYQAMEEWNFRYPLNDHQWEQREIALNNIWCHEKGFKYVNRELPEETEITEELIEHSKGILDSMNMIEEHRRKVHDQYPYLTYDECMSLADLTLEQQTEGEYFKSDAYGQELPADYQYNYMDLLKKMEKYIDLNDKRKIEETGKLEDNSDSVVAGMGILLGGLLKIMQHTKK